MRGEKGITLIALVITIIVLLILAGVTIATLTGENGILTKVNTAKITTEEQQAKEKLELVLTELGIDKRTNSNYSENKYINDKLTSEEMIVIEDIVIVDGWQFTIDRSVPKIGESIGKGEQEEQIQIEANHTINQEFTKATVNIEITYGKEIVKIICDGKEITPTKQDGKYIAQIEVSNNGNYTIVAKDKEDKFNYKTIKITELTEDMDIWNKADMESFRNKVNEGRTFEGRQARVKAEIDLENREWTPIGTENTDFKGNFDGENHTINNLYINTTESLQALFRANRGTIKNITVKGEVTANGDSVAGICARNYGTIENATNYAKVYNKTTDQAKTAGITALVSGNKASVIKCTNYGEVSSDFAHAGGIVGHAESEDFVIDSCYNYGKVTATQQTGGIIASIKVQGTIQNCINEGEITSTTGTGVGGILGVYYTGTTKPVIIKKCINKGKVQAKMNAAGGIVGDAWNMDISECKNIGEIIAACNCGGIIGSMGQNDAQICVGKIEKCANSGYIHTTGNEAVPTCGGIMGAIQRGDSVNINNCYNTGEIASTSYTTGYTNHAVGGILGTVYDNATATTTKSKATITNSYNTGNIKNSYSSSNAGQIIGKDYCNNRSLTKCYYLNTATGTNTNGGTAVVSGTLKTYATTLGEAFVTDTTNKNNGFPILKWEIN